VAKSLLKYLSLKLKTDSSALAVRELNTTDQRILISWFKLLVLLVLKLELL